MKTTFFKTVFLFALLIFISSCSKDDVNDLEPINVEIPETKAIEQEIMDIINNYRDSIGLTTLQVSNLSKYKAMEHNYYMIDRAEISHDNFTQRSEFLKAYDNAIAIAENVAFGYLTAESVVDAWKRSESHHRTMKGNYTHFEVSVEANHLGVYYFTNIFVKK